MNRLATVVIILVLTSCRGVNVPSKKVTIESLKKSNQLYSVKNSNYYYFMIDSIGSKFLVRTHAFNSSKVIWIENLIKK